VTKSSKATYQGQNDSFVLPMIYCYCLWDDLRLLSVLTRTYRHHG